MRYRKGEYAGEGYLCFYNLNIYHLFRSVSLCDGYIMRQALAAGEYMTGSDGTALLFESDNETVVTPAGTFDCCQLWTTKSHALYTGVSVYKAYYRTALHCRIRRTNCGAIDHVCSESIILTAGQDFSRCTFLLRKHLCACRLAGASQTLDGLARTKTTSFSLSFFVLVEVKRHFRKTNVLL